MIRRPPRSTLSLHDALPISVEHIEEPVLVRLHDHFARSAIDLQIRQGHLLHAVVVPLVSGNHLIVPLQFADRKSTRLNSSHLVISYAVFCLKKKNNHSILSIRILPPSPEPVALAFETGPILRPLLC